MSPELKNSGDDLATIESTSKNTYSHFHEPSDWMLLSCTDEPNLAIEFDFLAWNTLENINGGLLSSYFGLPEDSREFNSGKIKGISLNDIGSTSGNPINYI